MAKSLSVWIDDLRMQFNQSELEKEVMRAKITIGLTDPISGEIQYHTLEYKAKKYEKLSMKGGDNYDSNR